VNVQEQQVLDDLIEKKNAGWSLRQIRDYFGEPLTHGDIQRSLDGKLPVDERKRQALGLPYRVLVETCECGEVHTLPDEICASKQDVRVSVKRPRKRKGRAPRDLSDTELTSWWDAGVPMEDYIKQQYKSVPAGTLSEGGNYAKETL